MQLNAKSANWVNRYRELNIPAGLSFTWFPPHTGLVGWGQAMHGNPQNPLTLRVRELRREGGDPVIYDIVFGDTGSPGKH
jgi:hypothetical protein